MQTKENLSQTVKDVKVMETFPTEESCIRILYSLLKLQNENWEGKLVRNLSCPFLPSAAVCSKIIPFLFHSMKSNFWFHLQN